MIPSIFIVKLPKQYSLAPPGVIVGKRSTWFLKHGQWTCVESRQRPSGSKTINEWVERALFQFHPILDAVPAPYHTTDGSLILSLAPLQDYQSTHHDPQTIHSLSTRPLQVINALIRIVHGGKGGLIFGIVSPI